MPVHQQLGRADGIEGGLQCGVVVRQVGGEVRGLAVSAGPPALGQVQGVAGEPARAEVVGQFGVEEVVGVAVHQQHSALTAARWLTTTDERGDEFTLAVGICTEGQRLLPVAR
jgi:hypothetical protein